MIQPIAPVATLRDSIRDEIIKAIGLSTQGRLRRFLDPLFWAPSQRFAELAASFDQQVAQFGFYEAARWVLPRFVKGVEVHNAQNIPAEGPVIIASNHPGAVDSLALAANIKRSDLKIVASDIPFIRDLPATAEHLIYTPHPENQHGRMTVVRNAIRTLMEGGALLIFPSGRVDPDPEVLPGAQEALHNWSPSLELMLRRVPDTQLLITMVSGVLSPACLRHPFTRLRKELRQRQLLAEFIQIIQQMLAEKKFNLIPKITFSTPVTIEELRREISASGLLQAIVSRAQVLLATHLS